MVLHSKASIACANPQVSLPSSDACSVQGWRDAARAVCKDGVMQRVQCARMA
jgi:hypothetical protein